MIIAEKLKDANRAEYLLYLWQVEDIIRANGCDFDRLNQSYLSRFNLDDETLSRTRRWYADLCEMMHSEGVVARGHLQMSKNVLSGLEELHSRLLASPKFPYYKEMYHKVLPHVVCLRAKGAPKDESELQTLFEALYGVMTLRLQGKEVSAETTKAVADITTLLGQLSDYQIKDRKEPIDFD